MCVPKFFCIGDMGPFFGYQYNEPPQGKTLAQSPNSYLCFPVMGFSFFFNVALYVYEMYKFNIIEGKLAPSVAMQKVRMGGGGGGIEW